MVNKGFPQFSRMQDTAYVEILKNYNIPDFILKLISKKCDSPLIPKGRLYQKLQSMNDESLELLYKIFVKCQSDDKGEFEQYRFFTYVSSLYPKCDVLINEKISGLKNQYTIPILIKENEMYLAVGINKSKGNKINKKDIVNFFDMVIDIKKSEYGTLLCDGIFCSSVGFRSDAIDTIQSLCSSMKSDDENQLQFKLVSYENDMYVIQKCL